MSLVPPIHHIATSAGLHVDGRTRSVRVCGSTGTIVNINPYLIHRGTHLLIVGNDTVLISVCRAGAVRSIASSLALVLIYTLSANCRECELSSHSTTPTPTSSRGSSRECRRDVQLATGITSIARVGRVGEDPREEVGVSVSGRGMRAYSLLTNLRSLYNGRSSCDGLPKTLRVQHIQCILTNRSLYGM